jgi:redox-sensitive bicupin YhaK (pirin superfamily)
MIDHRPLSALPSANFGWLKARHHFPVNGLPDPVHKPVKSLYVWNDDQIAPGGGFPLHHHRDVEIITYVRSGAVTHQDTLGNTYDIRAGDVQVMSTGAGCATPKRTAGIRR